MQLEIKNLKVSEFMSEETLCFECTLYIDGQSRMIVSNRGHGGCDDHRPSKKSISNDEMNKDLDNLYAYCKTLPPRQTDFGEIEVSLDILVSELVEDYEIKRLLKKDLKKKVCLVKDDKFYSLKEKPTARLIQIVRDTQEPEGYTVLNSLPFNEAFPIYKRTFS